MLDIIPPQYRMLALAAAFAFVATAAFGSGWTANGWRLGKGAAEDKVAALTGAIETLTGRIDAAADRGKTLAGNLAALERQTSGLKEEIRNVLPEDDRACDYPAALRGVLNRASGYPVPDLDAPRPRGAPGRE
ncbi:hypothetical protein [Parvibaculum sp.]|uniref:hypothetical protein n=1 Tax=Parvibaculum sp. TaxID=2024848 RepID=UPI002733C3DB|nr:hypothetical protein [Parvibaculum sp.]MDP3327735.1 hypothetical protein [Parvibaculum sp.]